MLARNPGGRGPFGVPLNMSKTSENVFSSLKGPGGDNLYVYQREGLGEYVNGFGGGTPNIH
jgi:hypothetical protein